MKPVQVIYESDPGGRLNYGLVDHDLVRRTLYHGLFDPRNVLPAWFEALSDLEPKPKDGHDELVLRVRDGRKMYELSGKQDSLFRCPDCPMIDEEGKERVDNVNRMEMMMAIACSDAKDVSGRDFKSVRALQREVAGQSKEGFSEYWVESIMCR